MAFRTTCVAIPHRVGGQRRHTAAKEWAMSDRDPLDPMSQEPVPTEQQPTEPQPTEPVPPASYTPPPAPASVATSGTAAKADTGKRVLAYIIDLAVAWALGWIIPTFIGPLLGALYLLLRDGFDFDFMKGRSLGKHLMNLRLVRLDGGKVDLSTSASRNWTIALASLAGSLGVFGGIVTLGLTFLLIIVGIVLQLAEVVLTLTDAEGRRIGDKLAGTKVVDQPQ